MTKSILNIVLSLTRRLHHILELIIENAMNGLSTLFNGLKVIHFHD